jgi:hypothetical protein
MMPDIPKGVTLLACDLVDRQPLKEICLYCSALPFIELLHALLDQVRALLVRGCFGLYLLARL